jgi:hypothetical protein
MVSWMTFAIENYKILVNRLKSGRFGTEEITNARAAISLF